MKKILSIIIALALIFTALPMAMQVSAAQDGDFIYNIVNGEAQLTGISYSASGKITIPSYLGGYKVTSVNRNALYINNNITEVVFPDTITEMGDRVLYACKNLTKVKLPANLETMGSYTFWKCESLTEVTFGNKLTTVGADTFKECISLKEITLPNSITYIDGGTFNGCTALTKANYPNTMTILSYSTFSGCTALKEFTIPDSIEIIGEDAFYGCSALETINFSKNTKEIYGDAFRNCTSLKSVNLPDSVTTIMGAAFRGCSSLTDVTLGSGIASIDEYAFYNCSALSKIHLKSFGDWCEIDFQGRYALPTADNANVKLYVNGSVANKTIPEGSAKIGNYALYGSDIITLNLPSSVKSIGSYAFADCEKLLTVSGGSGLEAIQNNAFDDCSSLKTVTLSEGVVSVENRAFSGCSSLVSIVFPNTTESIGDYAFYGCGSLKTITLGENIKSLGENVFYSANKLEMVKVPSLESWLNIDFPAINSNPLNSGAALYINNQIPTVINIPEGVTEIKKYTFYGCDSITEVNLSSTVETIHEDAFKGSSVQTLNAKNVKTIKSGAFQDCGSLTTLTFEEGLETVDSWAFAYCDKLISAPLPDSIVSIGDYVFYGDNSLEEVHIGENLVSIGESVFPGSIKTVKAANLEHWLTLSFKAAASTPLNGGADLYFGDEKVTSIVIPEGTEFINDYAFYGCESVEYIRFADSILVIGDNALEYCTNLKEVVLGDGIFSINNWMFSNCSSLEKIHIPKTVQLVGDYAFYYCQNLKTVTYSGSESEAEVLKFMTEDTSNDNLLNATWEYNVCYHTYSTSEDYSCNKCYESLTPPAPTVEKVKYNSVTLKYVEGLEYSLDGINWQSSNVFTQLVQETEYTFYQRVKETSTSKQSEISESVTVTTPVKPPYTPYDCNDDGEINTSDLAALKLKLAGSGEVSEGADCNEDGEINTSDLAALKLKLAGN